MRTRRFLIFAALLISPPFLRLILAQSDSISKINDSISIRINAVEIKSKSNSRFDGKGVGLKELLTEEEFKKAACCTLSESFELTNTVEVTNADGVSGMKQIELLGLQSKYVSMTRENIPTAQGISNLNMLSNIPGPMVGGVHIAKGIGSVTGGADGITGGLNFALKSNLADPRIFLNAYSNNQGRNEFNAILKSVGKTALSHTYLHRGNQSITTDMGHDGFSDMPLYTRYVLGHHSQIPNKKWEMQLGGLFWLDDRTAGEVNHGKWGKLLTGNNRFNFGLKEQHADAYLKYGRFLNEERSKSIGNTFYLSNHRTRSTLNSLIGRQYEAEETRLYYSSALQTPEIDGHYSKTGIQVNVSQWEETLQDSLGFQWHQDGIFVETGLFTEWIFEGDAWSWVFGGRVDYHSVYGLYATPRLHGKLELNPNNKINFQGGLGRRTSYVFSENLPQWVNNRSIRIDRTDLLQKGLLPQEKAWNGGISYLKNFMLNDYPATLVLDGFFTRFTSQILIDRDFNLGEAILRYESGRKAGSNLAIQLDFNGYFHRRFTYRLSYRYLDSRGMYGGIMQLQPFQSQHRGIFFSQYQTRNNWFFDVVCQWNGKKRLPYFSNSSSTSSAMPGFSHPYAILNFQIRKDIGNWEIYSGVENILNTNQDFPILNADNKFDAGYAWGPTNGRTVYLGIRWTIK